MSVERKVNELFLENFSHTTFFTACSTICEQKGM